MLIASLLLLLFTLRWPLLNAEAGAGTGTPAATFTGEAEGDQLTPVSGIGDVNGDGIMSVDDCADDEAATYPGADEVACDCVDQDCDGEDLREGCDAED